MALLISIPGERAESARSQLAKLDPGLELRVWPDYGDPDDILCILSWQHPAGILHRFPHLRLIQSYGAGVDHILQDPQLPPGVPVCRVVDPSLPVQMNQYLVNAVLNHRFGINHYRQQQQQRLWLPVARAGGHRVGILGLGTLGSGAAAAFHNLGFEVHGWSRTPKSLRGVKSHTGESGLKEMAARCDYLVCLLPLTPATQDILNSGLFQNMKPGSYLINAGRGPHLVEADLIQALERGVLGGACLDVTRNEPLPPSDPLWQAPNITITPHISSLSDPVAVAQQVLENYSRIRRGETPLNRVDPRRGY